MTPPLTALGSVREFFVLRRAERTVAAYEPAQRGLVQAHAAAAGQRLAAARRTVPDVPAAVLLAEAVRHFLLATRAAGDAGAASAADHAGELPPLPADPGRPDASPADDERVRAALATNDPLYFDRLSPVDAARSRAALERAASFLARGVEARSLVNVRATRWGRIAALGVVASYAVLSTAAAIWLPKNVALERPVHPSSTRHGDGHELVDGEVATVPGVLTNVEDSPSATIDLGEPYTLDKVRVYNRIDQAFDDSLPLAVEISLDGAAYKMLERRDAHFSADPPWVITAHHEPARYVRLKVLKHGYLALSEVEVYGKKLAKKDAAHP
jgi:hypothetical protein